MALYGWAHMAAEHWKKYRPKMYRELVKSGQLESRANQAAQLTKDAVNQAFDEGMTYDEAWQTFRNQWMLLPSEEEMPNLGQDPNAPPDPGALIEPTPPRKPAR